MINEEKIGVIILAAGKGTRMKSEKPKVLLKILEKPMIFYLFDTLNKFNLAKIVTVISPDQDEIKKELKPYNTEFAIQQKTLGTCHAVLAAEKNFNDFNGNILIAAGDVPFLSFNTISDLLKNHTNKITVLSMIIPDPTGYGRIIFDKNSKKIKIVEEIEASESEKKINCVNSGIYLADKDFLFSACKKVKINKQKGEYFLTDIVEIASFENAIGNFPAKNYKELQGMNTKEDIERAEKYLL